MDAGDGAAAAARFKLALDLCEAGEAMMRETLRRRNPAADEATIERLLGEWLRDRPGAPHGDGEGRPADWRRSGR